MNKAQTTSRFAATPGCQPSSQPMTRTPPVRWLAVVLKENAMKRYVTQVMAAVAAVLALGGSVSGAGQGHCRYGGGGADQFKTLAAALKAAGLVDTLKGGGPFTVFAPTDAAFAKLPKGTVEELLKPENKAKLTAILTYHVVAGKVMAADVVKVTRTPRRCRAASIAVKVDGRQGDGRRRQRGEDRHRRVERRDSRHRQRADAEVDATGGGRAGRWRPALSSPRRGDGAAGCHTIRRICPSPFPNSNRLAPRSMRGCAS